MCLNSMKCWLGHYSNSLIQQRSFSNAELSVVRLSVRPSRLRGGGGRERGQSQKRFSNFSFLGMELLWDDINHISKDKINLVDSL